MTDTQFQSCIKTIFYSFFLTLIMIILANPSFSVVIPLVGQIENVEELKMAIMTVNNSNDDQNTINLGSVELVLDEALEPINRNLIINGGSDDPTDTSISGDDLFRIFEINTSVDVTFNNLTITNGKAANGGAIFNHNGANLTINNCIIKDSEADTDFGGGIYNLNAELNINDSDIVNNEAQEFGGGVYTNNQLTITNSMFSENNADEGGGIYNEEGILNINNSEMSQNTAVDFGGAIRTMGEDGMVDITNSMFLINNGGVGGAMAINASTVSITDSTYNMNESMAGGGAIRNFGELSIIRSTFSNNTTTDEGGGAIYYGGGSIEVKNSTFVGNQAKTHGGAIFDEMNNEFLSINNSTFTTNNADEIGGAINIIDGMPAAIQNTIIAGNTAVDDDPDVAGTFNSGGHNLIGIIGNASGFIDDVDGDIVGTDLSPVDPLFAFPLQDNGGPTFTLPLLAGSPAIDGGSTLSPGSNGNSCESTDQRGIPRPQAEFCDIGAFEVANAEVCGGDVCSPGDANADGIINIADVILTINVILGLEMFPGNADCNQDTIINVADVICIINKILAIE